MSINSDQPGSVIPAQLSFLAIYNPSLGSTDDFIRDQIVFYSSKITRIKRARSRKADRDEEDKKEHEEENEKLRQVGLAQGMVDFAKNFSSGRAVDSIETEKSRIVLNELETGWWILASIDLTRLPLNPPSGASAAQQDSPPTSSIEYSSREVCPPELILQHLLRAHSIFLLHHTSTLSDLYVKLSRTKFCNLLDRFWTRFIWNWDVLLHGNPAVDILNGLKLASGGELGMGVGEEEWGSGEREVLEGFVSRTEGLVDLVVSRFGEAPRKPGSVDTTGKKPKTSSTIKDETPWLGADTCPRPSDGIIFSGIGAVSRHSLVDISHWLQWIFMYGEDAYGVKENLSSAHRRKRRKIRSTDLNGKQPDAVPIIQGNLPTRRGRSHSPLQDSSASVDLPPGIPPPIVRAAEESLRKATVKASSKESSPTRENNKANEETPSEDSVFGTDKFMKYLTLGYGSAWGATSKKPPSHRRVSALREDRKTNDGSNEEPEPGTLQYIDPTPETSGGEEEKIIQKIDESIGRFIIGLRGDLENDAIDDEEENVEWESRMILRTLNVEMAATSSSPVRGDKDSFDIRSTKHQRLQVIVYLHQPFIFTFLFKLRTPTLSYPSFYRSIHHQLGPLQKPLLSSTSPEKVSQRILAASSDSSTTTFPTKTTFSKQQAYLAQPIYSLIYDPTHLTIHTSLPNIPEPGSLAAEGFSASGASASSLPWTRIEALNVHTQVLNTYINTRSRTGEIERTCKTNRGWWVVWMRLPPSNPNPDPTHDPSVRGGLERADREAFLVRKASDYVSPAGRKSGVGSGGGVMGGTGRWLAMRDVSGSSTGSQAAGSGGGGMGSVSEGVGVDARRYVEGLLSLSR